jgi:hypothetical protein
MLAAVLAVPSWLDGLAAEPMAITDPKDKVVVERFLQHATQVPAIIVTPEKCRTAVAENCPQFTWVLLPQLRMLMTAYELTGDTKHLEEFVRCFAIMRQVMTRAPDGFLGWYGKTLPVLQDPAEPDKKLDVVINSFTAVDVLSQFLEAVAADENLSKEFREQRAEYLDLIENHLVRKWDARGNYVDLGTGGAVYRLNTGYNPVTRAGLTLPHNMESKACRALLALYRVTGNDDYMRRAVKLGMRLKRCLALKDGHYEWHYWDPAGAWDVKGDDPTVWKHWIGAEHTAGYHNLTLSEAVALYHHGVVFDRTDMQRFVKTQVEVCWNGDNEKPVWRRVDGKAAPANQEFICPALAPFDERLDRFLHSGARQDQRVEGSVHTWQGGPVALPYIRGKYIEGQVARGGAPVYAHVGRKFLGTAENRGFCEALQFQVTEPGYKAPATPAEMKPMPSAPHGK